MADVHTRAQRSWNMSRIRSRDTKPERIVRSLIHQMGFRFRLHRRDLPGTPDLVFPKHRSVIFVHGCFWHRHSCRYGQARPATRAEFWNQKLNSNVRRDRQNQKALRAEGWNVLIVWECWLKDIDRILVPRLRKFLNSNRSPD